ncbi:hypothetical protein BREVNS_1540 [Brevinematales bacterium NS]|nr:hypothetical protein BREVNS_1540 [Brevinematales bacterium NS]
MKGALSSHIHTGYLHTKTEYSFDHLFSFYFGLFLSPIFLLSQSNPVRTKGALSSSHATHAPRTDNAPLLRARRKTSSPSRGSPSSVGDINSSSRLRQPQLVLLNSEEALPRRAKGAPPLLKPRPRPCGGFCSQRPSSPLAGWKKSL